MDKGCNLDVKHSMIFMNGKEGLEPFAGTLRNGKSLVDTRVTRKRIEREREGEGAARNDM